MILITYTKIEPTTDRSFHFNDAIISTLNFIWLLFIFYSVIVYEN